MQRVARGQRRHGERVTVTPNHKGVTMRSSAWPENATRPAEAGPCRCRRVPAVRNGGPFAVQPPQWRTGPQSMWTKFELEYLPTPPAWQDEAALYI